MLISYVVDKCILCSCKLISFNQLINIVCQSSGILVSMYDISCMHNIFQDQTDSSINTGSGVKTVKTKAKLCNVDARYSSTKEYANATTHNYVTLVLITVIGVTGYIMLVLTHETNQMVVCLNTFLALRYHKSLQGTVLYVTLLLF